MTVREFLTQNGLSAYADAFEARRVVMSDLQSMSEDDLRDDFGIAAFQDRKRFKSAVAGLTGASMFGEAAPLSGATRFEAPTPAPLSGATRFEAPTPAPLSGATRFEAPTPAPLSGATRFEPVGRTRVDAPSALPERLGSYRVLGLLGVGGMGTVVRARHTEEGWAQRQGGDVAIKLIHPQIASDATFRDRFFSEAELGRRVQHPGLVPTFDVIAEGAWLGTVMSLVVGEPLTNKVVSGGLPVSQVVTLLQPVAEALDHLHGLGIVHRDLKPANIMVRADGRPVVLDLGIAKDTQALENHTRTMTAMGTSAWMAPEQADAKHVDGAADRYALGMIAYALLAGRLPWEEGTSEARVLAAKIYGKLSSLEQVRSGLPGHVTAAVMKMVSVDAGGRYATCVAFVVALRVDDGAAARAAAEAAALKAKAAAKIESELEAEARMKDAAEASAKLKAAAESAIPAPVVPAAVAPAPVVPAPVVPAPVAPAPVAPAPAAPAPPAPPPTLAEASLALGTAQSIEDMAAEFELGGRAPVPTLSPRMESEPYARDYASQPESESESESESDFEPEPRGMGMLWVGLGVLVLGIVGVVAWGMSRPSEVAEAAPAEAAPAEAAPPAKAVAAAPPPTPREASPVPARAAFAAPPPAPKAMSAAEAAKPGWAFVNKGQFDPAFNVFSKALAQHPGNAGLLYGRGYASEKLGDAGSAVADYCEAMRSAGGDIRAELQAGVNRLKQTCP